MNKTCIFWNKKSLEIETIIAIVVNVYQMKKIFERENGKN